MGLFCSSLIAKLAGSRRASIFNGMLMFIILIHVCSIDFTFLWNVPLLRAFPLHLTGYSVYCRVCAHFSGGLLRALNAVHYCWQRKVCLWVVHFLLWLIIHFLIMNQINIVILLLTELKPHPGLDWDWRSICLGHKINLNYIFYVEIPVIKKTLLNNVFSWQGMGSQLAVIEASLILALVWIEKLSIVNMSPSVDLLLCFMAFILHL